VKHSVPFFARSFRTFIAFAILAASAFPAAAQTPNSQEQQIGSYLTSRRSGMVFDPIIARVARARAQDMADRGYFGHVNPDGVAANYLLRQAGYDLPDWWGNDRSANYVESIAAGLGSASATWESWMNSPDHRRHILGEDSFYASQKHYGVGFVADPSSRYRYYWVIITAPPRAEPDLAINTPAVGARLLVPQVNVTGTARAASGAAVVEVHVDHGSVPGTFKAATGISNWAAVLTDLQAGANVIRVRTRNASGAIIAEAARTIYHVQMSDLTVTVEQGGRVSAGFAGTTRREVGRVYTMIATPARGFLFAGWTGDVAAAGRTVRFAMRENMALTAKFVPNLFIPNQGAYRGLIESESADGLIQFSLVRTGVFSGWVLLDGAVSRFAGRFDVNGNASLSIPRTGASPLALTFAIDTQNGNGAISGTVSDGAFTAQFNADRAAYNATNRRAPLRGRYTVRLTAVGSKTGDVLPAGSAVASLSVTLSGRATIVGRLPDDTVFTQTAPLSSANEMKFFIPVRGGGSLIGTLALTEGESVVTGDLDWSTFDEQGAESEFTLQAFGSQFRLPARGVRVLNFAAGILGLAGSSTDSGVTLAPGTGEEVLLTTTHRLVNAEPASHLVRLIVNPANGLITGTVTDPATSAVSTVRGVVLQNQNSASGFFIESGESGAMTVTPAGQLIGWGHGDCAP
jgi:hypothetical protein